VKERPLVKSLAAEQSDDAALGILSHFRVEFYDCLYTRADALFELTDAVLCSDGPVTSLVESALTAGHRRGHGVMYDAVNHRWLEPRRPRRLPASMPLPRAADGRQPRLRRLRRQQLQHRPLSVREISPRHEPRSFIARDPLLTHGLVGH
jgi:hypothetical protein